MPRPKMEEAFIGISNEKAKEIAIEVISIICYTSLNKKGIQDHDLVGMMREKYPDSEEFAFACFVQGRIGQEFEDYALKRKGGTMEPSRIHKAMSLLRDTPVAEELSLIRNFLLKRSEKRRDDEESNYIRRGDNGF